MRKLWKKTVRAGTALVTAAWLLTSHCLWAEDDKKEGLPAHIAISPSLVELPIDDRPVSQSLTLFNLGEDAVDVEVSVYNWDLDENNEVRILPPTEQSLDQWMIVNPLHFTVEGGKSQTVRFSIRPRVKPEPGEHRAILYFSQRPQKEDQQTGMRVYFRLGVGVYGLAGEITRHGTLHSIQTETQDRSVTARFDISSEGNANVRMNGRYAVWPQTAFPGEKSALEALGETGEAAIENAALQGSLPTRPVLPGSRRTLTLPLTLPAAGEYVLAIQGRLGEAPFSRILPFKISR